MQQLIGVGVIIKNDGKILLGKRIGSHGAGTWGLPGGHLEPGEEVEICAEREVTEETGMEISNIVRRGFSETVYEDLQRQYITLFVAAVSYTGEPQNCEPDKCEEWRWCDPRDLPEPLFAPLRSFLRQGNTL